MDIEWLRIPVRALDLDCQLLAQQRQNQLTKPNGSLGNLETLAVRLAGMQGRVCPRIDRPWVSVFAADHGVAARGVSAFPQQVTGEMIRNFSRGGAAVNVIAAEVGARLEVVNVGSRHPLEPLHSVVDARVCDGTADFTAEAAMSHAQLAEALAVGREAVRRALSENADLFIAGEMGIGNTTAAAAVTASLLGLQAQQTVGVGTGIDAERLRRKIQVVDHALSLHADVIHGPLDSLRHLGGLEIAAMTGVYLSAAQQGLPFIVDGYISSAAYLIACKHDQHVAQWGLLGHKSAEPGHAHILAALDQQPMLDLSMRLGEGSGAALCVHLLKTALALHEKMATFEQASVSGAD